MNGFLLKNAEGVLGLIVLEEERVIRKVTFLVHENALAIAFQDGKQDKLATRINPEFAIELCRSSSIFVGHFGRDGLEGEPKNEYHAMLSIFGATVTEDGVVQPPRARPWDRLPNVLG